MKYLFILLLLFLQSCAHVSHFETESDRMKQLELELAEHEYDKALARIDNTFLEDASPNREYEQKRKVILDQLRLFEKQTISTALTQEKNGDWPGAQLIYKKALDKNGSSVVLQDAKQAMMRRFQGKMEMLENEVLIVSGELLQKKIPLLAELQAGDPSDIVVTWRYSSVKADARQTAMELVKLGEKMLAENNLAMAKRTLPLAAKLSPEDPEVQSAYQLLKSRLEKRKLEKRKGKKQVAKKNDKKHIDAFNLAMARGKLSKARQHLERLTPAMKKTVAVELMQERLGRTINEFVMEELSIGDAFYRVGEYKQAIKVWENILKIDKHNEFVKTKVERAVTVIENLKALRERQNGKKELLNTF